MYAGHGRVKVGGERRSRLFYAHVGWMKFAFRYAMLVRRCWMKIGLCLEWIIGIHKGRFIVFSFRI